MIKHLLSKIEVHPIFWIVMGAGLLTGYFWEVLMIFTIVFIHECGHAAAAYHFRWRINKIKLLPFGGVAEVDEYGNRGFKEEFIVLIAGPIQHLWLPLISLGLSHFSFWTYNDHLMFLEKNKMILIFNLLPIWPLDGGKLLRLLLTKYVPYKKAHHVFLILSGFLFAFFIGISYILMPLGLNLNFLVIMLFILSTHITEWRHHQYVFMRFLIERRDQDQRGDFKHKALFVSPEVPLSRVLEMFYKGFLHRIIVKDQGQRKIMEERELLDLYFEGNNGNHAIGDFFGKI